MGNVHAEVHDKQNYWRMLAERLCDKFNAWSRQLSR